MNAYMWMHLGQIGCSYLSLVIVSSPGHEWMTMVFSWQTKAHTGHPSDIIQTLGYIQSLLYGCNS